MKKKPAPQSAFLNLPVLIGLVSVVLAVLGFAAFPAQAQLPDPLVPALFDCSQIHALGIDQQENMRAGAIMIFCGEAQGGAGFPAGGSSNSLQQLLAPLAPMYGGTDVDLVTGAETSPDVTQSETFTAGNPDNPLQIVAAYNDSRGRFASPINISGASVSTDGGRTFTRLTRASTGQSPFANTLGDPVILYKRNNGTWYTVWLDLSSGGQGLGGYKSTTPSDPDSWTHYSIHTGSSDDRESGWVDNNPSSPFYGRMYVSWNDFAAGQGIFVSYSDDGVTWTKRQITTTFIRNVQITGDLGTGDVYIAGMDEMGGGLGNRANRFYKSTDGGNTWTNTYVGPTFAAPGRGSSGYFATMYSLPSAYWRHMGWGEPAALNGVVHYVYAARDTTTTDPGNVFYIRSTDGGVTFSAPVMLNSDINPLKAQWQPNLSVAADGSLFAVWYDERDGGGASTCVAGQPTPCYRMYARKSIDNGATWLPDQPFSDVVSPLPAQPDPGIVATYVGDYDYGSPAGSEHFHAWVDGRVSINGASQQDAFFDREPSVVSGTITHVRNPGDTTPEIIPSGASSCAIAAYGAGMGGMADANAGGGGGSYCAKTISLNSGDAGKTIPYHVAKPGLIGENTTIGSVVLSSGTVNMKAGSGGQTSVGAGGTATGGDTNTPGGNGSTSTGGNAGGPGGGLGGPPMQNGMAPGGGGGSCTTPGTEGHGAGGQINFTYTVTA